MLAKLLKMALGNLRRYGLRNGLTVLGLALAIAVVMFVNSIALRFEAGTSGVYRYLRQIPAGLATVWVTPPQGFGLDPQTGFFTTSGSLPDSLLAGSAEPLVRGLVGTLATDPPMVVYGRSDADAVRLNPAAAQQLRAKMGSELSLAGQRLRVGEIRNLIPDSATALVEMPLLLAQQILNRPGELSWILLRAQDLSRLEQADILVTTDPTQRAEAGAGVAYLLEGRLSRADTVSFDVKLAAVYFNQAGSSLLGWLARFTLGLGFVLMLSAALLSLEERRREFGILTAVGVSSDVLYLFLIESAVLFVGSTLIGLGVGMGLFRGLTPALWSGPVVLKSAALVLCYLPPMVIFGSLIPAQRLLQKSPLELLRSVL